MRRRHLLGCCAGLAAGLFTGLEAHAAPLDPAAPSAAAPSREPLWAGTVAGDLVARALCGLEPGALWDTHAHLLGVGDAGSGCRIHDAMDQWWHPVEYVRKRAILGAAGIGAGAPSVDRAFVERLLALTRDFPAGARWLLFAFDAAHDDVGRERRDWTSLYVPNAYASEVARAYPDRFEWVASVHPYRADALERLDAAIAGGARAVKWLPSAMNIDPRDARCRAYFARLARSGVPLIVHFGEEHAVPGAERGDLGNPLLARVPLAAGVRVIAAHCASLGRARDIDRRSAPRVPAFDLFARLMDEPAWRQLLLGDVSALFQVNRSARVWRTVLRRDDWHARLLHGSDHPLPSLAALTPLPRLVASGLLAANAAAPLHGIRRYNPLLFDLVLKRSLRDGSAHLHASVFDTRGHFAAPSATVAAASRGETA